MKLLGKQANKTGLLKVLAGTALGLAIGIALSFATACYDGGWLGYGIAAALIGFAAVLGYWIGKNGGWKLLYHEDVYYRIGGYVAFGLILFLATWALFFFGIKRQNLLYDSFVIQKLFKSDIIPTIGDWGTKTFGETWKIFGREHKVAETVGTWGNVLVLTFKYFLNHLVFVIPFILMMNLIKIGRWNLSVIYFAVYTIMWGAVVGSNSLAFPVGNNPMAGPIVVFARYGLWVWFSYLLLMTSTAQFATWTTSKWIGGEWRAERKLWPVSFSPDQREVFIYGLLFLLASSFAEARIFVFYNL